MASSSRFPSLPIRIKGGESIDKPPEVRTSVLLRLEQGTQSLGPIRSIFSPYRALVRPGVRDKGALRSCLLSTPPNPWTDPFSPISLGLSPNFHLPSPHVKHRFSSPLCPRKPWNIGVGCFCYGFFAGGQSVKRNTGHNRITLHFVQLTSCFRT